MHVTQQKWSQSAGAWWTACHSWPLLKVPSWGHGARGRVTEVRWSVAHVRVVSWKGTGRGHSEFWSKMTTQSVGWGAGICTPRFCCLCGEWRQQVLGAPVWAWVPGPWSSHAMQGHCSRPRSGHTLSSRETHLRHALAL